MKFDICWGYNNIWIKPGDEWKVAFLTPKGLFEPTVMFFGLTNSWAMFQMMMNTIFRREVQEGWFLVFMDNSIIYTKRLPGEMEEQHQQRHWQLVHHIFDILEKNDLYIKPEKCMFEQEEIKYLGVIIGKGKTWIDPKKLMAVANYPNPKNPTDVHAFLGFTGYYWYFIQGYLQITWPLLDLIKKTEAQHWDEPQGKAFLTLRRLMCSTPVLMQPDFSKKFYLQTDASRYGMGAVLSQEGGPETFTTTLVQWHKPVLHLIAYYSATFMPTEQNYDVYNRELLAFMKALVHWRQYLGWTKIPFTIMTDHANLQYWKSPQNLTWHVAHWHIGLQEYNYEIQYIPRKQNAPPDTLSRLPEANQGKEDNQAVMVLPPEKFKAVTITPEDKDKVHILPLNEVKRGIMKLVHDHPSMGHPGHDETLRKTQEGYYWPGMKEWIMEYIKGCMVCQQNKILTHQKSTPIYHILMEASMQPFQRVTMDLITGLPPVTGKDAILIIVDQGCSHAAIFLLCSTMITGPGIAQLYHNHIFRWFRLPTKIISDRDPNFTSHFSRAFIKKLGVEQNLSMVFHLQMHGLSEQKNQWIEQYLRLLSSTAPEDWTYWLALTSAIHNNQRNSTTGLLTNQILLGYDIALNLRDTSSTTIELAKECNHIMIEQWAQVIEVLNQAVEKSGKPEAQYTMGAQVWLEGKNLKLPYQAMKLMSKRYGSFKIIKEVSPMAYQLELP
jgi:hypothetical protein